MKVIVTGGEMNVEEQQHYIRSVLEKYPQAEIKAVHLAVDGEFVNVSIEPQKSVLTKMGGTLIGNPLKWNNAKRAECYETIPNRIDL